MTRNSKTARQDRIRKVQAGLTKYYGSQPQVRVAGTTYTPAALQQFLTGDVAASDAADQAKAAWQKAVVAQNASHTQTNPVLRAIRSMVLADYGDSESASDVLAVFGYSPRKPYKATGAENVAKAEKAAATRKARGTKGSQQKKEITGETATSSTAASSTTPAKA